MRLYTVSFTSTASAAALDLFELLAPAAGAIELHWVDLAQISDFGDAQDEVLNYFVKRGNSSVTTGSGGTTPTPTPRLTGDVAASFTAKAVNTTQMTGGTIVTLHNSAFNVRVGLDKVWTPETRYRCKAGERLVVSVAAPADSLTWVGTCCVEELF